MKITVILLDLFFPFVAIVNCVNASQQQSVSQTMTINKAIEDDIDDMDNIPQIPMAGDNGALASDIATLAAGAMAVTAMKEHVNHVNKHHHNIHHFNEPAGKFINDNYHCEHTIESIPGTNMLEENITTTRNGHTTHTHNIRPMSAEMQNSGVVYMRSSGSSSRSYSRSHTHYHSNSSSFTPF